MSDSSDTEEQKIIALDEEGMPEKGPYGGTEGGMNPAVVYPILQIVLNALGVLCAWGIYALTRTQDCDDANLDDAIYRRCLANFSPGSYDAKIETLKVLELGYLYVAVRILQQVLQWQQIFVAFARKQAKADNPDQYIYKTQLKDDPVVRLVMKGPIGAFNRAQRAIDNTREIFAGLVADVLLGGYVFPKPMLICVCVYFCARMAFSAGYMKSVEARGGGQAISFLTMMVIGGLMLFSGIKSLL